MLVTIIYSTGCIETMQYSQSFVRVQYQWFIERIKVR